MMKSEFENLYGKTVSPELYEQIELVYNFHPFFQSGSGIDDKRLIADFCKDYLPLIQDLAVTARHFQQIEEDVQKASSEMAAARLHYIEKLQAQTAEIHDYMEVQ